MDRCSARREQTDLKSILAQAAAIVQRPVTRDLAPHARDITHTAKTQTSACAVAVQQHGDVWRMWVQSNLRIFEMSSQLAILSCSVPALVSTCLAELSEVGKENYILEKLLFGLAISR